MVRTVEGKESVSLDAGVYNATISGCVDRDSNLKEGGFYYAWEAQIHGAKYKGEPMGDDQFITWLTSATLSTHQSCKLRKLYAAVGVSWEPGEKRNPEEDLVGRQVRLVIVDEQRANGTFSTVTDFMPPS